MLGFPGANSREIRSPAVRAACVGWLAWSILGCSSGGHYLGPPPDAFAPDDAERRPDAAPAQDLRSGGMGCGGVVCGAHAHCDMGSATCVCDMGFGGDPNTGCAALTPCGSCPLYSHCDQQSNTCACEPGYVQSGNKCIVGPLVDPATHSAAAVCDAWKQGHLITDANPWKAGNNMCDPGTLSRAAIDDTLRRANLFRFLAGLAPIVDDANWDASDQQCAVMESANGMLNHTPPNNWMCWTQAAYNASSTSNLAAGTATPADAIDLFMDDSGVPSLGHRRWLVFPPMNNTGVGFARAYTCLEVIQSGNQMPPGQWHAVPNPGPTPLRLAQLATWSFHSNSISTANATVTVVQKDTGAMLPVTTSQLPQGYGENALAIVRNNWAPAAGKTYTVTLANTSQGTIAYDVMPLACN